MELSQYFKDSLKEAKGMNQIYFIYVNSVLMKPYENIKNEGTSGILKGTW